jgi:DNA-directed RNA polymerase specialized sigma24 family protein
MSSHGSVTGWVAQLQAGDAVAAQYLWERYYRRLVGLARQKLLGRPRAAADEEDVALSAFDSFCRDARRNRFPQLNDRDDLWRLLVTMTAQKSLDLVRREQAAKRGGGRTAGLDLGVLAQVVGTEPSPEFAAQVAEECQRLLGALRDPQLQALAVWKMEGYSNEEIAAKLGCVPRTVERRLQVIRKLWSQEEAPGPQSG